MSVDVANNFFGRKTMPEPLADIVLELCAETVEFDPSALACIDKQPSRVRAAAALVIFAGLTRRQQLDVARRAEEIEAAMAAPGLTQP